MSQKALGRAGLIWANSSLQQRKRATALAVAATVCAGLLLASGVTLGITFKPPYKKGSWFASKSVSRGCGHRFILVGDLTTGRTRADSDAFAGNIISPCFSGHANLTVGYSSPSFAPTFSGSHKILFSWTLTWNAWLNTTCGRAGCSYASGMILLLGSVIDMTTRATIRVGQVPIWANNSTSGIHLAFGQTAANYSIAFSAPLNASHAYELRTMLMTGGFASAPAGGLYSLSRVNIGMGADSGWLLSMAAK